MTTNRFCGFQDEGGVAVLDTLTGGLVYYPFDGGPERVLSPPRAQVGDGAGLVVAGPAETASAPTRAAGVSDRVRLRPERRLDKPRAMVIQSPPAGEVAAIKAARLASLRAARESRPSADGVAAPKPGEEPEG